MPCTQPEVFKIFEQGDIVTFVPYVTYAHQRAVAFTVNCVLIYIKISTYSFVQCYILQQHFFGPHPSVGNMTALLHVWFFHLEKKNTILRVHCC